MSFARAGAVYAVANVASAFLPFLLLPLLTRVLDPAEFARVVAFALLVTLSGTAAGLNVHGAMGMIWFRKPAEEVPSYLGAALVVITLTTAAVAGLVALILAWAPALGSGLSPLWGAAAALTAGANILVQTRLVLWQSQNRPLISAAVQFGGSAVNFALSLVGVLLLSLEAAGRNGGIVLAGVLTALLCVATFVAGRGLNLGFRRDHVTILIGFGAPLVVHTMGAVLLSTADRWAVSIRLDAAALGVYGAAAQLGLLMSLVGDAFVKAFSPWLYGKLKGATDQDRLFAVGAVYGSIPAFLIIAVIVGLGLVVASGFVLGPQYRQATGILPWFTAGGAMTGVYLCTSGLYFYHARTGLLASVSLSAGVLGAACTWWLVSRFGLVGAAAGYALTQAFLACASTVVAMRTFDLPWSRPAAALSTWTTSLIAPLRTHLSKQRNPIQ
jgi:O-antigen/teichoic acid export membrane protein